MHGSWLRRAACLPAGAIYSMGFVRSGGRLVVNSALEAAGLLDPRKEAMEALDEMIKNVYEVETHDGIMCEFCLCMNTGAEGSGKTTMLRLSCNHFVNSSRRLRKRRPCCAIFISFEDDPGQDCDKTMTAKQRVYNRILFALREHRDMGLEEFLAHSGEQDFFLDDIFARIRKVCGEDAYVLIAADELRKCGDGHATDPRHAVQQKCVDAMYALRNLVRESFDETIGIRRVYVVASSSSPVDVIQFRNQSFTLTTLQPMLPIAHEQLLAALQLCGVDPARCDQQSQDLVRALLSCSTRPRCTALVESVRNNADAMPRLLAALQQMSSASNVDSYVRFVCNDFQSIADVDVAVELLKLLFTPRSVCYRSVIAIDAMCYDVCRVLPCSRWNSGWQDSDTVMMRPCDIVALSERVISAMTATHAAAFPPTHNSRLCAEAIREFGVALRDASVGPCSGRGLVPLFKSLLHCLQYRDPDFLFCDEFLDCAGALVFKDALVNVKSVATLPHAADNQHESTWSVECTVDVVERRILPCVCAPADPYNVLLDVVLVEPSEDCMSARTLWIVLRAGEITKAGALEAWRDRRRHLTASTVAAQAITHFAGTVEILWVHVAVRKPSNFDAPSARCRPPPRPPSRSTTSTSRPKYDEALLTLEGAKAWCPSLRFAEAAAVVWGSPLQTVPKEET